MVAAGLLACAGIFVASLWFRGDLGIYSRDSEQYWKIGRSVAEGRGLSFDGVRPTRMRQPLYPLMIAGVTSLFGPSVRPVQLLQLAMAMATVIIIAVVARQVFGEWVAAVAGLVAGLYYPFPVLATEIRTEALSILLVAIVVLSWLLAVRGGSPWWAVLCGGVLGLGTLTRSAAASLVVLMPIAMWLVLRGRSGAWRRPLIALAVAVLCLIPWGLRNWLALGEATVLSNAGPATFYVGVHPMVVSHWAHYMCSIERTPGYRELRGDSSYLGPEAARRFRQAAVRRVREDPWGVFRRCLVKVAIAWTYPPGSREVLERSERAFDALRVPQIALLLLIVWGAVRSPRELRAMAVAMFLGVSATVFLGTPTARYTLPFMPLGLVLLSRALEGLRRIPSEQAGTPAER